MFEDILGDGTRFRVGDRVHIIKDIPFPEVQGNLYGSPERTKDRERLAGTFVELVDHQRVSGIDYYNARIIVGKHYNEKWWMPEDWLV